MTSPQVKSEEAGALMISWLYDTTDVCFIGFAISVDTRSVFVDPHIRSYRFAPLTLGNQYDVTINVVVDDINEPFNTPVVIQLVTVSEYSINGLY